MNFTVLCVTYKDKELVEKLIKSFEKFKRDTDKVNYIIVENTLDESNKKYVEGLSPDLKYINVPFGEKYNIPSGKSSMGHGMAFEVGKQHVEDEYTFICHSDCLVTSSEFFNEFENKINEGFELIGVSFDSHPNRIKAIHCSGYMVKTEILNSTRMLPILPKIDTTDLVTKYCRDNSKKIYCFRNTYNEKPLVDIINEPFKSLGPDCGVDRCLDSKNNILYIHQGKKD